MNAAFVWLLNAGPSIFGLTVFIAFVIAGEAGYRLGHRQALSQQGDYTVTSALTAAMLGLLAFILGLTINFAQNRYEARRDLVVTEANAIGTAWLRAKLVEAPEGPAIAGLIRNFAQDRLEFTRAGPDSPLAAGDGRAARDEHAIWDLAADAARKAPTPITATLIDALNEMFDSAQAQRFAFLGEAPPGMFDALVLGAIIAIGAMGFETGLRGPRKPFLSALLLIMWTGGIEITADLNRARHGAIRVDTRPLQWTIQEMAEGSAPPVPGGRS
jgi:hypothetical protein